MKKFIFYILVTGLLLSFLPNQIKANTLISIMIVYANPADAETAKVLQSRLVQINEMDKSSLNMSEKSDLRNEVSLINKKLCNGNGIYLSMVALYMISFTLLILL